MDIRFSPSNMILAIKGNGVSCFLFCVAYEFGEGSQMYLTVNVCFQLKMFECYLERI